MYQESKTASMRGGSWFNIQMWGRGAVRYDGYPPDRDDDGGFRLAKSSRKEVSMRGGSWYNVPYGVRGAARDWFAPHGGNGNRGFRLARTRANGGSANLGSCISPKVGFGLAPAHQPR